MHRGFLSKEFTNWPYLYSSDLNTHHEFLRELFLLMAIKHVLQSTNISFFLFSQPPLLAATLTRFSHFILLKFFLFTQGILMSLRSHTVSLDVVNMCF